MPRLQPPLDEFEPDDLDFPAFEVPPRPLSRSPRTAANRPSTNSRSTAARQPRTRGGGARNRLEDLDLEDDWEAPLPPPRARGGARRTKIEDEDDLARPATGARRAPGSRAGSARPGTGSAAGSKRAGATRPATSRGQIRPPAALSGLRPVHYEIIGIALVALGGVLGFNAFRSVPDGALTSYTLFGLRFGFGIGARILPFLLCYLGILLFVRRERANLRAFALGGGLSFLMILTAVHLLVPAGSEFESDGIVSNYGGLLGAAMATLLRKSVGSAGAVVVLMAGSLMALLLWTDTSIGIASRGLRRKLSENWNETAANLKAGNEERALVRQDKKAVRQAEREARRAALEEAAWEREQAWEEEEQRAGGRPHTSGYRSGRRASVFFPLEEVEPGVKRGFREPAAEPEDSGYPDEFVAEVDPESTVDEPRFLAQTAAPLPSSPEVIEVNPFEARLQNRAAGNPAAPQITPPVAPGVEGMTPVTATPLVGAPAAATPSAVAPSAVAPSAVAPSAVAPSAVTPGAAAPSVATPSVATPFAAPPVPEAPEIPAQPEAAAEPNPAEGVRIEILDAPPPPSVVDPPQPLFVDTTAGYRSLEELTPIEALEAQALASATESEETPAVPTYVDERPRRRFGDGPLMPVYFDEGVRALDPPVPPDLAGVEEDIQQGVKSVQETLSAFKIDARVTDVKRGPVITRYEVQPAPGVRVASIANLDRDLARSLAALAVRIEAPVPGKNVVGIEVPNKKVHLVRMRDVLEQHDFLAHQSKLAFVLGKDIAGQPKWGDLTKMPHMLIAGSTNSGKSVCLNSIIASILVRAAPDEVRFSLIDPKRVELTLYRGIPHLMHDVVVEPKQAVVALRRAIEEMDRRYKLFATRGVRNIASYNSKLQPGDKPMPYIVIVIDELADLMMTAAAEFEKLICRLAQLARATGIHLIVATQRPSVNVITGVIKANIPARIAFAVASQVDSRTILDAVGAERLIGSGDMLYDSNNGGKSTRIQGAFLSEEEVNRIVGVVKDAYLHEDSLPPDLPTFDLYTEDSDDDGFESKSSPEEKRDDLYDSIKEFVLRHQDMSASMIQRKFEIGYPRAGRIVDQLERDGVLGPADGPKPRKVLGPGKP